MRHVCKSRWNYDTKEVVTARRRQAMVGKVLVGALIALAVLVGTVF